VQLASLQPRLALPSAELLRFAVICSVADRVTRKVTRPRAALPSANWIAGVISKSYARIPGLGEMPNIGRVFQVSTERLPILGAIRCA